MLPRQEPVGLLIGAARRGIKQAVARLARPLDLTPPQFWFLNAAREMPGAALGAIARRQHLDATHVSRLVEALAKRGLIALAPDPADRRAVLVRLTGAGDRLAQKISPIAASVRGAVVRDLSEREQEALRKSLRKVIANLERLGNGR
jgi:DNA-binding MarR family transcriptional regulator